MDYVAFVPPDFGGIVTTFVPLAFGVVRMLQDPTVLKFRFFGDKSWVWFTMLRYTHLPTHASDSMKVNLLGNPARS